MAAPTTDFEGYSHEQLLAMIASLDPETVRARAAQLAKAAEAINEIGESLKRHRVTGWEGEAAHAFQDWVSRAGSATLLLGRYGEAAGTWMTHAAQTMVEVRANTPAYDTEAAATLKATRHHPNDPDAEPLARTAHAKLTGDRDRAVQQLTKLAQSYDTSTTQLSRAQIPTFPPPPGVFEPLSVSPDVTRARPNGGSGGNSGSGHPPSVRSVSSSAAFSRELEWAPETQPPSGVAMSSETGPVASLAGLRANRPDISLDHAVLLSGGTVPSSAGLQGGSAPRVPGSEGHVVAGSFASSAPPSTGGPLSVTQPLTGTGGKVGGVPGAASRDTGIVGGQPISAGGPGAGVLRGTDIGVEGPHAIGGRVMPGVTGGGFGVPSSPSGEPVVGRRLAVESGGIVGGRQVAAGGGQPFTQGGSGLVRSGAGVSGVGFGGAQAPSWRREGRGGDRPDYLAEDEETWQVNRQVVPPVIG